LAEDKIKMFSLSIIYPGSLKSPKPKFFYAINKELRNLGVEVIVIPLV